MNNELLTMTREEYLKKYFPIVNPAALSMEDTFIKNYQPNTIRQQKKYEEIVAAIQIGVPKFRAQIMDPSLDKENIFYGEGNKPAVGKSPAWWIEKASEFMPEKNSHMGSKRQRNICIGHLIKYLVEEQHFDISHAWNIVCDNSKAIGHFFDSKNAKARLETTGSRKVAGFFDWGNTLKFLQEESMILCEGGAFMLNGCDYPLTHSDEYTDPKRACNYAVGWITMDP